MLSSPLVSATFAAENPLASASLDSDPSVAFAQLRMALADYQLQPGDASRWAELLRTRRVAAAKIARLPRKETNSWVVEDARQLVRDVVNSGALDRPVEAEDRGQADVFAPRGWPGLLAGMLLLPAWQWPNAPVLVAVPDWLRGDFVAWAFASPQGFCELGDTERFAKHTLSRLEELLRWVNRCPGVEAETEVLSAFATKSSAIPLYFSTSSLRRHAELRGQLLRRAFVSPHDQFDGAVAPRNGRRLRVGIVNRHFGSQTETYTTLPTFEQLDPERFEVILFAHRSGDTPLEDYCRKQAADFFVLPDDTESQISLLRSAALDVVVFGTNLTAVFNEVVRLALHRVAPLQVVNNSSCITSGLPEVDLYVSGTLTETSSAPEHFTERLGLLPGPAHAFNYYADRQEPQAVCTRAEFGIPDDAFVFVSAANYFKVIPEMQHVWAELLASVPGAYLLLHPYNPNWTSDYPMARFRAEFDRVLTENGVDASRVAISTTSFPSRTDVKTLLGLGNAYLDTFPFGGVNSLVDPLELSLPVVAWEGATFRSRMGAALLRQLDLPELVTASREDYLKTAVKLATDATWRQTLGTRIGEKMERTPLFLDSLAASEAFGDLVETAYDELAALGREAFRTNRTPLQVAAEESNGETEAADLMTMGRARLRRSPADAIARHRVGRALLEAGRTQRAVTYLLGALQGEEARPELWLDVARALKADGQLSEAVQALEAGLKLDQTLLEGWVLFAELAYALGSMDIAREAAGVARQLAPDDTRVLPYL